MFIVLVFGGPAGFEAGTSYIYTRSGVVTQQFMLSRLIYRNYPKFSDRQV